MTDLTCSHAREMISARVDGELSTTNGLALDTHLGSCAACQDYQADAFALRRTLSMHVVPEPESATLPAATQVGGSLRTVSLLRYALFVIGASLVLLNVPSIISPDGGVAAHLDRHDGVFGTALGIGMLAVAARPQRAIGLVPITSAVAGLMLVAALTDLIAGNANLLSEAIHVLQLAGLICLWVISGGPSRIPKYFAAVQALSPRSIRISN